MDNFVGQVIQVGFNFAPVGWLPCDGNLYNISEYEVLFALIGTTYGGDGVTTFAVPDLRGRMALHQGTGGSRTYGLGQQYGVESVTLSGQQNPQHRHNIAAQDTAPSTPILSPGGNFFSASSVGQFGPSGSNVTGNLLSPAGGDQSHENRMPSLAIYSIICTAGYYPSPV